MQTESPKLEIAGLSKQFNPTGADAKKILHDVGRIAGEFVCIVGERLRKTTLIRSDGLSANLRLRDQQQCRPRPVGPRRPAGFAAPVAQRTRQCGVRSEVLKDREESLATARELVSSGPPARNRSRISCRAACVSVSILLERSRSVGHHADG